MQLHDGESLFTERRTVTFRKEVFEYIHNGIKDANGETWTTTELDEANVNQVCNQYREKHGIPFPDEIIRLRRHYGLSASKMSEILGFGINQYRYYENGEVPSESNSRIIIAIRDKVTFMEFLDASKDKLGEKDYFKIKERIQKLGDFKKYSQSPTSASGYVSCDLDKIKGTVLYFIQYMGSTFVTKMNKLLYYSDFLSYKRRGYGITGLRYLAMQYGPVPENWGMVYNSLNGVEMNECILPNQSSGIKLESRTEEEVDSITDFEKQVLKDVCLRFSTMSAREISSESHKELGWRDNCEHRSIIDYEYAFELSID